MDNNHEKIFKHAKEIATDNLRQCYSDGKIKASLKNFSDFWARDTFYAIFGVLEIGDFEVARTSLEYFLSYQRSDGKIPRKIALDYNGLKYLFGKSFPRKKPRAIWTSNLPPFSCMDTNALFVIAFSLYVEKTGDLEFAKKYYQRVKDALSWYRHHFRNGFIQEYALSNWMDVVFKNGNVLYTNVLYAASLKSLAKLASVLDEKNDKNDFEVKYEILRFNINQQFWNGQWFDDQLYRHKNFDLAGNVLACYFEIADTEKISIILKRIISLRQEKVLLPTVDPKYPWWKINPVTYPFGMQDYQNGASWMWIDLFVIAAMNKNNFVSEGLQYLLDISKVILQNEAVHETYFNDGRPYKVKHWESAVPFAWGSGVFLKVYSEVSKSVQPVKY